MSFLLDVLTCAIGVVVASFALVAIVKVSEIASARTERREGKRLRPS